MWIIEISALANGAHRNQQGLFSRIPEGWAVIPEGMELPNFPFGEVEAEEIGGVMTVTQWTAGTIPEPEPEPERQPTMNERLTALENAITEGLALYEEDLGNG